MFSVDFDEELDPVQFVLAVMVESWYFQTLGVWQVKNRRKLKEHVTRSDIELVILGLENCGPGGKIKYEILPDRTVSYTVYQKKFAPELDLQIFGSFKIPSDHLVFWNVFMFMALFAIASGETSGEHEVLAPGGPIQSTANPILKELFPEKKVVFGMTDDGSLKFKVQQ